MKKPLLWLVRHGTTTDSELNIFRGQRNSVLDKKGFLDAHDLKDFFAKREWKRVFCTEMARAVQTATIICGDQDDAHPETVEGAEPWNIGWLTGKPKTAENKKWIQYYDEHLSESPEGGESIYEFEGRVWPLLVALIQTGWEQGTPCIFVAHSSIIHTLNHLLEGHKNHREIAVKPGGVVEVYMQDGEITHDAIYKKHHDDSSFATGKEALERS
jgi:broad specificity phosphatase PhoE